LLGLPEIPLSGLALRNDRFGRNRAPPPAILRFFPGGIVSVSPNLTAEVLTPSGGDKYTTPIIGYAEIEELTQVRTFCPYVVFFRHSEAGLVSQTIFFMPAVSAPPYGSF